MTSNDLWPPWKWIGIIYSPRATNIPSLKFRQLSLIEIPCLQGFQTLTTGDLKWPLTSMKNNRDHLTTKGYQHTKFEVQATFTCWDTVFTSFSDFDLWWPSNDLWPPWRNNRDHLPTKGLPTYQVWSSANFHLLRYRVYKVFRLLPLVTSNDLWPPWKTIGIIYPPRATNILSLKFRQLSPVEIPCLQGFQTLTSGDPQMTFDLHEKQ